ncbi:23S rRNA (adenine(1618)-N(6))-methyltransferase RlmF [Undibacterium sp. LX40W]|uniref:Ribosomal RNA large subunit methyltransferase F n=1 Tax=Undibacterium nitidum TaxID=2762298 RepID=A0A923KT99_9BURK|nr:MULTISPECIES: 23S rRNA (adenine(1618)-N(6))-methyltransferase RlmF [Undibacterium]MBC3881339.1 23S rRNA (adenine(1618)-N(6))-methyltransferase RlmF [Undibacterium nitidum]MBC3891878.1 23S rRNA (adenine(1618)-N(6))-methyltransferase RlmF [Undibacterium sp. LX40W]
MSISVNAPKRQAIFHPRNKHQGEYDFKQLIAADEVNPEPRLADFVQANLAGILSIDFSQAAAVKALNRALLTSQYNIRGWNIPDGNLCPPIPGRVDYIHYLADLLKMSNHGKTPKKSSIHVLDIGTGANGVYPLLGASEYAWHFVASDINQSSLSNVQGILEANPSIAKQIEIRKQGDANAIFRNVIGADEWFDLSMCNPPFHASLEDAEAGTKRKWKNLGNQNANKKATLNFGGTDAELWCPGGEAAFIEKMILESALFKTQCFWFTCLVSKASNLTTLIKLLKRVQALQIKTIEMQQGQKQSRFIAWTFLTPSQQASWAKLRW